jgi:hypothetical protein
MAPPQQNGADKLPCQNRAQDFFESKLNRVYSEMDGGDRTQEESHGIQSYIICT